MPCMISYSHEWAFRCALEYKLCCGEACCLTLTYSDEYLETPSLNRDDLTKFIKRLRSKHSIRYFGCGEYGSKNGRPHFHVIIFGYSFPDKKRFKLSGKNNVVYTSAELSRLWPFGFATIGDFNETTAAYCAKYLSKLRPAPEGCKPSFTFMSLKPSIGFGALTMEDFERGYVYHKGKKRFIPRSFYQSLKRQGVEFPELQEQRLNAVDDIDDDELFLEQLYSSRCTEKYFDMLHIPY